MAPAFKNPNPSKVSTQNLRDRSTVEILRTASSSTTSTSSLLVKYLRRIYEPEVPSKSQTSRLSLRASRHYSEIETPCRFYAQLRLSEVPQKITLHAPHSYIQTEVTPSSRNTNPIIPAIFRRTHVQTVPEILYCYVKLFRKHDCPKYNLLPKDSRKDSTRNLSSLHKTISQTRLS